MWLISINIKEIVLEVNMCLFFVLNRDTLRLLEGRYVREYWR
jgi:hypothetical protein